MAEKRVSVRLVAEGGRQVRAELEGIGVAGAREFGRLSTEMELANTRLAGFARKAGIALAAVTVAAAAAGVAIVRSGLETIGAQAAMAASLKTTVESLQVLTWAGELAGVSMGEIEKAEIACRGTGSIKINIEAMNKLQSLRNRLGKPLIVRSGYRSPGHNRAVGGAPASKHMLGTAFDIAMSNHDPVTFAEAASAVGFLGFGTYPRSGFMHIDLGPAQSWGEPFPARATPFVPETPPAREVLSESRTLKGGGAAGIATVGAAGVEVAQEVLAEIQSAILPLVPDLDTLRWVFIAVALIGIAVAIHARIDDWKKGQR